ncbi:4-sulfomuconolactone hydrolase [Tanacetum coccineum]
MATTVVSSQTLSTCRKLSLFSSSSTRKIKNLKAASKFRVMAMSTKIIDSHLHVWASPQEAKDKYPYVPGQEPTLRGNFDFLLDCMGEAGVDGALVVQPINHKFDHSYVTSVLKKHPSKFVGCCLANPAEDGSGIQQLEHLILTDGYRAVRFNPYLWPSGQQMTNDIGKAMFSKAGELGVPVGNDEESKVLSQLLGLSRFPQVYVKFSALFRVSRNPFPYEDLSPLLAQLVSSFGANHVMWGSDFPFVVEECGYKEAKEAVSLIANQVPLSSSDLEWIMGKTAMQLFHGQWVAS